MFKKKFNVKPAAPLRSSDRRKLAESIIQDYNLQPESPEATEQTDEQKAEISAARTSLRNSLLPENIQSARFTTTHGPDLRAVSGTFYIGAHDGKDSRILWWQMTDGRISPSIYTIWKQPDMVALLFTPGIVIEKMRGGADLMTPGLANRLPFPSKATKGAIVTVADSEYPAVPIAVGVCEVDVAALEQISGTKGVAVTNLHWAGDELYNFSPSSRPAPPIPDKVEDWDRWFIQQETRDKLGELSIEDTDEGGVAVQSSQDVDQTEADDTSPPLTQEEVDDTFRNAFLYGVYHHKKSNSPPHYGLSFPINQSLVMSNLVQPFLPAFTAAQSQQLQIKKTSWKNTKKFIKSFEKRKMIKCKEKDAHETAILDIDFDDAAIVTFTPYRLPKKEAADDKVAEQIDVGDDAIGQSLEVKTFLKASPKLSPIFARCEKSQLTASEVREVVTAYIATENLASATNKRMIKLDTTLGNAVFDGSGALDKEVISKGFVPRDALVDRVLQSMSSSYAIVRNNADLSSVKVRPGNAPKIQIVLENRGSNKTVTKVSGLEAYFIQPRPLADELRKICAGSTTIEPLSGATKKNEKPIEEVMVQGPQKVAVLSALAKRGVKPNWIEVVDKTKGKKK